MAKTIGADLTDKVNRPAELSDSHGLVRAFPTWIRIEGARGDRFTWNRDSECRSNQIHIYAAHDDDRRIRHKNSRDPI